MNGFSTALRSEFFIAKHTTASKFVLVTPALIVVVQNFITWLVESGNSARDGLMNNNGLDEIILSNAYGYFVDGMDTGITILALLLVSAAAHSLSYDRDSGFIRHLIIRRVSRPALILAKFTFINLLAIASFAILVITTYSITGLFWEYGPIIEDGFELISEQEIIAEIYLGLQLAIIPLPAAIAFGTMISAIAQTAAQALMTALGLTLAIDIFKSTLGNYADYLYARFLPSLIDTSYLSDVSRLVRGYSDVLVDANVLQMNTLIPLPTVIIFIGIALFIIKRKQV